MVGHSASRCNFQSRRSGGFTLVEVIISIVLIGMVAAVGTSMLKDPFDTARMVNANNASAGQARYALERLAREIREVKFDSSTGAYAITTMTAPKMVFTKTDASGIDFTVTIDYSSPPNLTLQYSSLAVPVVPAVTSLVSNQASVFSLAYLDNNDCLTTVLDNSTSSAVCPAGGAATGGAVGGVRFVVITLTVIDPATGVQSTAQRTRVALRNQ